MREKIYLCLKIAILCLIIIVVSFSTNTIVLKDLNKESKLSEKQNNPDNSDFFDNNNTTIDDKAMEQKEDKKPESKNSSTTSSTGKENKSSINGMVDKNLTDNQKNDTNLNTKSNQEETTITQEPKQEEKENTQEDLTKIASQNDFYYSITGGKVEFSTNAGCMKAGDDISFIDVVDVQYFRCYEVHSMADTIMGYYLNIFCESGNCNSKYKAMINIYDYD